MSPALAEPSVQKQPTPPTEWDREAFQKQVLEAIKSVGSVVQGDSMRDLGDKLGLQDFPVRRIKSAFWHLTREGALEHTSALPAGIDPGGSPEDDSFYIHCYRVIPG